MPDYEALKARLQELTDRKWDLAAIESRCKTIRQGSFQNRIPNREHIASHRAKILDRLQRRAEEYNFFAHNCARSSALAVMEEFGLGHTDILKALAPFPGFGGTGWMCGGVSGGLVAIGLMTGSSDLLNVEAMQRSMAAGRQFMARFEEEVGAFTCPKIQETVVFGRYMDPGAGPENMEAFVQANGFAKCSLLPGIGARIAGEIILDLI